jgi:hypothetical protein
VGAHKDRTAEARSVENHNELRIDAGFDVSVDLPELLVALLLDLSADLLKPTTVEKNVSIVLQLSPQGLTVTLLKLPQNDKIYKEGQNLKFSVFTEAIFMCSRNKN